MTPPEEPPVYSREIAKIGNFVIKEDFLRLRLRLELAKFPKDYMKQLISNPDKIHEYQDLVQGVLQKIIEDYTILSYAETAKIELDPKIIEEKTEAQQKQWNAKAFESFLSENNVPLSRWRQIIEDEIKIKLIMNAEFGNKIRVPTEEVVKYYNSHAEDFQTTERVRVRQIVTDTIEKANEIHERLLDGENFAKVAINHSLSPDRAKGGDLGYFSKGTFPKEFDDVCFSLAKGDISGVVKSDYGYHIFKLLDKKPAGRKSLTEVGGQIQQILFGEKVKQLYDHWIQKVRKAVPVLIHEDVLKTFVL